MIIHYGPGGLTPYDATSFLTVFYFSAVALALELILLLAWGIATAATIFRRANTHVTARAIIPVCILLLSASFSAINLASVYGAPALSTIIATISVLVCIFIPVVATSIMGFIDTTERRK
ncbi:hypothetical protein CMUST_14945 [Corynebacterium mustelae]|uniref:Uncharacterized protein n=1 Tax=Corynebacterium mustelae TaxID=571915 RepID=A0A0G3H614_9CORY|nr:hypothetical protein CMUST_14945 [Corynebacterium mustelae]